MVCPKCLKEIWGLSIRVNPIGETGVFWCAKCVSIYEPELYRNETEDGVLRDINKALTGKDLL